MSDWFYTIVRTFGRHPFWLSSRPVVIGVDQTRRSGAFIVASTHQSPYDVPLMIRHAARRLDFVTTTEACANPLVRWFYTSVNAFPLDRSKRDTAAVRTMLARLERGRIVALFPEGGLRIGADSVVHTRKIRRGVVGIARMAKVPIVPCVVINSAAYSRARSWLPIGKVRYGIAFGPPIPPGDDDEQIERQLVDAFIDLHGQLQARLNPNEITSSCAETDSDRARTTSQCRK